MIGRNQRSAPNGNVFVAVNPEPEKTDRQEPAKSDHEFIP